jgi:DNA-directed RNA polymerase sigma subunit (sigma70/sigma32)
MKLNASSQTQPQELDEPTMPITEVIGIKAPEAELEPEEEEDMSTNMTPYELYSLNPTKQNLAAVTKQLRPTIDSVIASMGDAGNPYLRSRANIITAKAIKSYNPDSGASLATWVSSQLRQLTRDVRKSNNALTIPEGVQLDSYALYRAEREFMDEHDREPTLTELADLTHLSPKRIVHIRKRVKAVVADGATIGEDGTELAKGEETDHSQEAMDYIYNDSDSTDQKLMEYLLGYGGETPLDNKAIMQKLKLTPVQLTRRKARLAFRINNIISDLER